MCTTYIVMHVAYSTIQPLNGVLTGAKLQYRDTKKDFDFRKRPLCRKSEIL